MPTTKHSARQSAEIQLPTPCNSQHPTKATLPFSIPKTLNSDAKAIGHFETTTHSIHSISRRGPIQSIPFRGEDPFKSIPIRGYQPFNPFHSEIHSIQFNSISRRGNIHFNPRYIQPFHCGVVWIVSIDGRGCLHFSCLINNKYDRLRSQRDNTHCTERTRPQPQYVEPSDGLSNTLSIFSLTSVGTPGTDLMSRTCCQNCSLITKVKLMPV